MESLTLGVALFKFTLLGPGHGFTCHCPCSSPPLTRAGKTLFPGFQGTGLVTPEGALRQDSGDK